MDIMNLRLTIPYLELLNSSTRYLLLIICVCMCLSAYPAQTDPPTQILQKLYEAKKYNAVISTFKKLESTQLSDTESRSCNYLMGKSYYKLKETSEAIQNINASILHDQHGIIVMDEQNQKSTYWLGYIFYATGKKEKSIVAYKNSLDLLNQLKDKDYDKHIDIMIKIAKASTRLGQIDEAESYYKLAIEYQLDFVKPYQYRRHAYLLAQYASHKTRHDHFNQSRELINESLLLFKENNDSISKEYFYCMSKSASLHKNLEEYDMAMNQTKIIYNHSKKGPLNSTHAYNCRRIGNIYYLTKDYKLARQYYDLAIKHYNQLGVESKDYISVLSERGGIENETNNFPKGIEYKLKSLALAEKLYGGITIESTFNLKTLAWSYLRTGQPNEALKYYKIALEVLENTYSDNTQRLHNMLDDIAFTYHELGDYKNADYYYQRYHDGLKKKTEEVKSGYNEKDYLNISAKFHDEINELNLLTYHSGYNNSKWSKQSYNNLLNLRSGFLFANKKHSKTEKNGISYLDVKRNLDYNQIAIEFFDTSIYGDDCKTICALILDKKSDAPEAVTLFNIDNFNNIYELENSGSPLARNNLDSILVKKLEERITVNKPELFYALSQTFYELAVDISQLPFTYQQVEFHHLFSTRSIIKNEDVDHSQINIIYAIGDIDYSSEVDTLRMCQQSWSDLIYDEMEINNINQYCTYSKYYNSTVYKSYDAKEKNISENLQNSPPNIVHFATHGFFNRNLDSSPLGQCGLVLNDVNLCADNKSEDGILSGLEIKEFDLSKTELVVLSSCYSGKGDIKYLEGIFGLQRAFKLAGAKNIIFSLNEVSDLYSMKFMNSFYNNLIKKEKTTHDAFYATKFEMTSSVNDKLSFVLVES